MDYIAQSERPFPASMSGDLEGAFVDRLLDDGDVLYVIIRPRRYLTARDRELIDQGRVSLEELHPEVRRLVRTPPAETRWLYELESFRVAQGHHDDQETFNDNATHYRSTTFDDLSVLLDHCRKEFGVSSSDFTVRASTRYPER